MTEKEINSGRLKHGRWNNIDMDMSEAFKRFMWIKFNDWTEKITFLHISRN